MNLSRRYLALAAVVSTVWMAGCATDVDSVPGGVEEDDGLTSSAAANRLVDLPFYFTVPKSAVTTEIDRAKYSYPTVWNPSVEVPNAGLRVIAVRQNSTSPAHKYAARVDMAKQLARAGVLQDGDIALTFRPELQGTMAYPHIQMGSTHASLVYTKNGEAFNVDSPMNDNEYVGQFNTLHFTGGVNASGAVETGVDALHILRPKGFSDARRAQLQKWATAIATNRGYGKIRFQSDYLSPIFASTGKTTRQTVTTLGKIIMKIPVADFGAAANGGQLNMYCSEFAWHMLALSNCSDQQIKDAGPEGAECVDPVFQPMDLAGKTSQAVGLAEGPLLALQQAPSAQQGALVDQIFAPGNATRLSTGHRLVSESVAPLMPGLQQYFHARAAGATAEQTASVAEALNAGVQNIPNYSPTAFLVNAMQSAENRKVEYVATVLFFERSGDYAKAKRLAMPQGSSIPQ